ncbi:MAG TPA: PH domain-containing protein [Bryobacteraceae bacterium]|jgi:hypothetical protein
MQTGEFQAPYDGTTKAISAVVAVFFLLVTVFLHNAYLGLLPVLVLVGAYAYSARGYAVENGAIVVRRLAGSVRIPLDEVQSARRAEPGDYLGCIRLWGSGGMFGYYGLFRTAKLGRCTWYMTDRSRAVVVRTGAKTVLLSPGDVEGFLAAVGAPAESPGDAAGAEAAARSVFRMKVAAGAIALVVGLTGLGFVAGVSRYAPGPPQYVLTPGGLEIHDRFYPVTIGAASVEAAGVRVVDLAEESGWRPAIRTSGFANSHYRSGFFRAKNGRRMRLYWANGTRVVLLPPKGEGSDKNDDVLLEVGDPEGFVRDVRTEWVR